MADELTVSNDFNQILMKRHAIRKFVPNVTISHDEMLEMLDEACKAPSAMNVQPWRFVVIDTPVGKQHLADAAKPISKTILGASSLVLIGGDLKPQAQTDDIFTKATKAGLMGQQEYSFMKPMVDGVLKSFEANPQSLREFNLQNTAFPSMLFMLIAREHGYDTCAMTGFDHQAVIPALDLDASSFMPTLLIAIGKAAESGQPSYRIPAKHITTFK